MGLFLSRITALPKPKRRWLQFSLRTLLVGMTILGVWLGVQTDRARRQARAVRALEKLPGQLTFDYQLQGPGPWPAEAYDDVRRDIEPPGPRWLRRLVGDDYFRTVVACDFWDREAVAYLPDLPHLRYVWAGGLRDEDMAHLAGLSMLQGLNLSCSTNVVTDEGLKHLKDQRHLEELWLSPQCTGTGLAHLGEVSKLKMIWLGRAATGAGLQQALKLPALTELSASKSEGITDHDLQHLTTAPQLEYLRIEEMNITDKGLGHLRALPNLKRLWLTNVPITDSGLEHLASLSGLQSLDLHGTIVTKEGIRRLQQAMPSTRIDH